MTVWPKNLVVVRFASTSVIIKNSADFNLRITDDTDKGLIALVRLLADIVYIIYILIYIYNYNYYI